MDRNAILSAAAEYVRKLHESDSTGHDWPHIERVAAWAGRLADETGADRFVCELAALFHDAADDKLVASKEAALKAIEAWLIDAGVDADLAGQVLGIVAGISYRGGNGAPVETLEARVVQDADRLDAIGAIGIARTFMYAGAKGHRMHDPSVVPRAAMSEAEYLSVQGTAIQHFHEKLLKLRGLMNTEPAKRAAEERHAFMLAFLDRFEREWAAERLE